MKWKVQYTTGSNGKAYVFRFIHALERDLRVRVIRLLTALENKGLEIDSKHIKKIHPQLFELRVIGHEHVRIIFAIRGNTIVVLHGFMKKSWKVPLKEIETSLKRLLH